MDEKGVELVIECLVRHRFVPNVQSEGCRFLEVIRQEACIAWRGVSLAYSRLDAGRPAQQRTMRTNNDQTHGPSKLSTPFFQASSTEAACRRRRRRRRRRSSCTDGNKGGCRKGLAHATAGRVWARVVWQGLRVVVVMDAIRHNPLESRVLEDAIKALGTLALDTTHQMVRPCFPYTLHLSQSHLSQRLRPASLRTNKARGQLGHLWCHSHDSGTTTARERAAAGDRASGRHRAADPRHAAPPPPQYHPGHAACLLARGCTCGRPRTAPALLSGHRGVAS